MKTAYFDCPSGISGDMVLGALIDLGLDVKILKKELSKLPVSGYSISTSKDRRHHIAGTRFKVAFRESRHHRTFKDIKNLIAKSELSQTVKERSLSIFSTLASAEAKVHGCKVGDVHFHEVGAVDSIVDVVGSAIGIEQLGIEKIYSSPLPIGSGWTSSSHGKLPVPAPATLEILKGAQIVSSPIAAELTTPTGAAIIKTLACNFGEIPAMTIKETGCGIGSKDFEEIPNMLRIITGEESGDVERLLMIETNIDDMNPQIYEYLTERLFKQGALDVFFAPIYMKKGRPAVLLKVLCKQDKKDAVMETIFEETTTIGVRVYEVSRYCLERKTELVSTPYGKMRVKISQRQGRPVNIQPEYEDCKAIAKKKKTPLKDVMDAAKRAYYNKGSI